MKKKIVDKLRIEEKIRKLSSEDRKIFELMVYRIFFIKFPKITLEFVDSFSSKSIDSKTCEEFRDDVFHNIFKPLLRKYKFLRTNFELKGELISKQKKDNDYEEYLFLKRVTEPFQIFKDYRQINDLMILGEAIAAYDWMKNNLKETPDFYFVSCDHIFIPFQTDGKIRKDVSESIKTKYGIIVASSKYALEHLEQSL